VLRTRYIWGDPLRGSGNIEPDRYQLPPRAGRVLRCSTGGRADAALRRATGLDIGQINFILHAINCILRVDICIHKPHNLVMEAQSSGPLNQGNKIMNTRDQLAIVEAKIKKLQAQQKALRAEAIEGGFAHYVQTIRNTAPSLTWWKEQHPKTWQRYAKETKVNTFAWKD